MHCHCGTNNRAPGWTFMDPCKPEVRPGAQEESIGLLDLLEIKKTCKDKLIEDH